MCNLKKLNLENAGMWLLLLIPLSFKIEFLPGVILYPQEVLLPIILLIALKRRRFKIPKNHFLNSYQFLLVALVIILIRTIISLTSFADITGLLKTIKVVLLITYVWVLSFKLLENKDLFKKINAIGLLTIIGSLSLFLLNKQINYSTDSWALYLWRSTWMIEVMPTGFSNLVFNFSNFTFVKYSPNHGVYGTFLVLLYLLNLGFYFDNPQYTNRNYHLLACGLCLVNILLLTSRESLLVFGFVHVAWFFRGLLRQRVKVNIAWFLFSFSIVLLFFSTFLNVWISDLTIVSKLIHTYESISQGGSESNINARFNVWLLIFEQFSSFPLLIIIGLGYNPSNFKYHLEMAESSLGTNLHFSGVPENFFLTFLAYGGIVSLFLALGFYFHVFTRILSWTRKNPGVLAWLFLGFWIGIFFSNNTGASLLSDLLLVQFMIIYLLISKYNNSKISFFVCAKE